MLAIEIVLLILIIIIIAGIIASTTVFFLKKAHSQPLSERKIEIEKMTKRVLLSNQWYNIDDVIDILQKNSVHVDFKLREYNEEKII